MTGEPRNPRRSPLASRLVVGSAETVRLCDVPWRTLVELRIAHGVGQDADTMAMESALGLQLPGAGRNSGDPARLAVWLGPGWWLLDAPDSEGGGPKGLEGQLVHKLRDLGGRVSAVEVSAGFLVLELSGSWAPAVLAHGCSIDLHPRVFGPGRSARTMLAKADIVLAQIDSAAPSSVPTYRIWVRSSFARYVAAWLVDAATEYLSEAGT